jgi:hypothetical protein
LRQGEEQAGGDEAPDAVGMEDLYKEIGPDTCDTRVSGAEPVGDSWDRATAKNGPRRIGLPLSILPPKLQRERIDTCSC